MAIPKRQLDRWTKQGAVTNSKKTYRTLKRTLESKRSALSQHDHDWEVYLQGSYANYTNIYGDSDVDIVVRLRSTWRSDLSDLSPEEKRAYDEAYVDADYTGRDFYEDVRTSLYRRFKRANVHPGAKAIKVDRDGAPIPVDADVVPCVVHRNYNYFHGKADDEQDYDEGMNFQTRDGGRQIVNYSQLHQTAGEQKNQPERTSGNYKPTIRMFKNARNKCVKSGSSPMTPPPPTTSSASSRTSRIATSEGSRRRGSRASWATSTAPHSIRSPSSVGCDLCSTGRTRIAGTSGAPAVHRRAPDRLEYVVMHPYATHTARWRTIGGLMLVAVVLTGGVNTALEAAGRQLGFRAGSLSAFAIFGLLYAAFDRFLWRWPLVRRFTSSPDLNGEWVGEINSSYRPESADTDGDRRPDGGQPMDGETQMSVSQRWSSIEVKVTNPGSSRSESTSATFRTHKNDPELLFTYVNKPIGEAASELSMHEGTNTLRYTQSVDGDDMLEGEYYTDEQRNNHGTMRFTRVEE